MDNIIQQIANEWVENLLKKSFSEKIKDLDKLAAEIFEDCAETARLILQEVISMYNQRLRNEKKSRVAKGLVIKEKERPRQLMTKLEVIEWKRDYYYDKNNQEYVYLLDSILGVTS